MCGRFLIHDTNIYETQLLFPLWSIDFCLPFDIWMYEPWAYTHLKVSHNFVLIFISPALANMQTSLKQLKQP